MVTTAPAWKALPFLEGLEGSQIARLEEIAVPVSWDAGAIIYRDGDPGSPVYLIEEGRVAIELAVPGKGVVTILTVGPGEVVGWSGLFYQRPKSASARAALSTRAVAFDSAKLRALCDDDPVFGYALTRRILQLVSERLKAARIQLLDVFQD